MILAVTIRRDTGVPILTSKWVSTLAEISAICDDRENWREGSSVILCQRDRAHGVQTIPLCLADRQDVENAFLHFCKEV